MNWLYSFSTTEYLFTGLFVCLYAFYIWRTFRLARQLGTTAWGVVPKFFLRSSYLILLMIALLGPSFGEASADLITSGRDVFLIIDVSRSMDADDVVPTRLERVKYDVQQLCDTLAADRFGLIVSSTESFVLSPLTADHDAIRQSVRDVRTTVSPTGGTNLCEAIELARQKLLTDPSTRQNAKAIVIFSDGENFNTCDRTAMARLRTFRIPLVTMGVGTEGGASIRQGRDFIRDADRQIVRSRLNRSFLQRLALETQGRYIEVESQDQHIDELASYMRSLQGRVVDQQQVAVSTNKYYYFVLAALVLILFDLIITVRTFRL
ncbi:Ca-activated chloride channel family protein [Spirosoma lacussanchae]|uniref:vWA domain-containing protein n=1 Tax=Spirosoma lacussanchae TaxID=1884249 RepID=UPI001108E3B4|nr:VWA domain-containing protein [Spirosoma lacussanchae]